MCVWGGGGREGVLLNKQNLLSVCDKLFVHSPLPIYLKKNMQCYANINYVKNTQDTMLLIKNMKVNYWNSPWKFHFLHTYFSKFFLHSNILIFSLVIYIVKTSMSMHGASSICKHRNSWYPTWEHIKHHILLLEISQASYSAKHHQHQSPPALKHKNDAC